MIQIKNIIKLTIFALAIFVLASSVWYSPVMFKGFALWGAGGNTILGRNLAQTGVYGAESKLNVILSPNLIKSQAHVSSVGNKLTPVLYAEIFKIWGELTEHELILLSIAIHAFALIIFSLVVLYLFGFKISLIFSSVYILFPFNWRLTNNAGSYEFALLFFSFFFLFYLCGKEQKRNYIYLGLSGIFLALACLSREALLLFAPFLFIYLWIVKQRRHLLYILIPFLILFGYFWAPNTYLLLFTDQAPEELKSADFSRYGHFFPDPYIYHFNREEFLANYQNQLDSEKTNFLTKTFLIKSGANNGIRTPNLWERAKVGLVLSLGHLSRFFSWEEMGGPFIFLLMLLGIYSLRQKNKFLFRLSVGWIISVVFLLSFVVLASRQHLMDFNWILALFAALGLTGLSEIICQYFHCNQIKSIILLVIITSTAWYTLVLANHTAWNRLYDSNQESSLRMQIYSQKIEKFNVSEEDVIASPLRLSHLYRLNYLNNRSLVIFQEETVKDLLNSGELNYAFEKFGVKYILGYSPHLSKEITKQTQKVNIADASMKPSQIEISPTKSWLLNLIR